ncbi:hypothetical protein BC829DRAFT_417075 [Chytridium lagenaria]|nr:hypothetical protein BC829DRAFT_417075 [Chytridium lagenaria]
MARQSSRRSAPARSAPPPAPRPSAQVPAQAAPAQPPMVPQQAQPQQPGMFAQMATTAAGVSRKCCGPHHRCWLTGLFSGGSREPAPSSNSKPPPSSNPNTTAKAFASRIRGHSRLVSTRTRRISMLASSTLICGSSARLTTGSGLKVEEVRHVDLVSF